VYGPTETTIWSTTAEVAGEPEDPLPVGVPVRATEVFIAGPDGRRRPPGIAGEVCIAGAGVARGYRNAPELTADRFGDDPAAGRFYRTGDRARWRADGQLELIGRADRQVKIRGHRIELGEVEAALARHPGVSVVAALRHEALPEPDRMVAFVQPTRPADPAGPSTLSVDELWQQARRHLPSYALPTRLVVLDKLPLTSSGKVAHRALARYPLEPAPGGPVAPSSVDGRFRVTGPSSVDDPDGVTGLLVELWRELLDDPALGAQDNFFLSGGHSLIAVRLIGRIADALHVDVPLGTVLDAPTPARLADAIRGLA
jgi:hypothetical protein